MTDRNASINALLVSVNAAATNAKAAMVDRQGSEILQDAYSDLNSLYCRLCLLLERADRG